MYITTVGCVFDSLTIHLKTMKTKFLQTIVLTFVLAIAATAVAQDHIGKVNWKTNPFENKVFIENNGQFNMAPGINSEILFGIKNPGEDIFFTKKGMSFLYKVPVKSEEEEKRNPGKPETYPYNERKESGVTFEYRQVTMEWNGANENVQVIAENPSSETFNYYSPNSPEGVIRCKVFKKIIYKNLYKGVDVEYVFHKENGLKYNIILRLGADASLIKMKYSGSENIRIDANGNLIIETVRGDIIDHAPHTFYENGTTIESKFELSDNTISFVLNLKSIKSIIIDPWTISPGFSTENKGYDIVRNPANGEIFVMGGCPPYEVKKFTPAGGLVYTYVTTPIYDAVSNFYGDIEIDPAGDFFISNGCCNGMIAKINGNTNALIWASISPPGENFRLRYDVLNNVLLSAGGNFGAYIASIDPVNGTQISLATIISGGNGEEEVRSFAVAPNNNIYCLHVSPNWYVNGNSMPPTPFTNLLSGNTPSFASIFTVQSGYLLHETGPHYTCISSSGGGWHGFNGIALASNYIYTYDGATIFRRNISNGASLGSATGGYTDGNSGIVVDACGNVFVGTENAIRQYDSLLTFVSSVAMPGPVYDLILGTPGEILATGNGFVASVNFSCIASVSVNATGTSVCAGNCATITANPSGGTLPYTYSWNPIGQTTQAIIVCPSSNTTYTVTITDAAGNIATDTAVVSINPGVNASITGTITICSGSSTTLTASGASTYFWSPSTGLSATTGATVIATPISTTTYTVTGTDANGCINTTTLTVGGGSPPIADFNHIPFDIISAPAPINFIDVSVGNPSIWSWNFGDPNSGINNISSAQNPSHVYSDIGTYCITLIISDVTGFCKDSTVKCLMVEAPFTFYIPNAFTSNNDGFNEFFTAFGTNIKEFNMTIFNRWGEKIWSCHTYGNPQADTKCSWDGRVNGQVVQEDVYVWKVDLIDFKDKAHTYIGHLTLVK